LFNFRDGGERFKNVTANIKTTRVSSLYKKEEKKKSAAKGTHLVELFDY
jgi:hypothetical protein